MFERSFDCIFFRKELLILSYGLPEALRYEILFDIVFRRGKQVWRKSGRFVPENDNHHGSSRTDFSLQLHILNFSFLNFLSKEGYRIYSIKRLPRISAAPN